MSGYGWVKWAARQRGVLLGTSTTRARLQSLLKNIRNTLPKYQHEENMDEDTPGNTQGMSDNIRKDYAAYERSKSRPFHVNDTRELGIGIAEDLESLAEQYGNGSWDGYEGIIR